MPCCPTTPCPPAAPSPLSAGSLLFGQCGLPDITFTPLPVFRCNGQFRLAVPRFSVDSQPWPGAAIVVKQFNFSAPSSFRVKKLPRDTNPEYVAAIRWRVGTTAYRYLLHEVSPGDALYFPVITQDVIVGANFVIEVWQRKAATGTIDHKGAIQFIAEATGASSQCLTPEPCNALWYEYPGVFVVTFSECVMWLDNDETPPESLRLDQDPAGWTIHFDQDPSNHVTLDQ